MQVLPEGSPLWLIAVAVVVPMLLTFVKGMADVSGPLGALARWWEKRNVRKAKNVIELDEVLAEAVDKRVEWQVAPLKKEVAALERDIREERRLRIEGEQEISLLREYAVVAVRREFLLSQFLAQHGLEVPPPPLLSFDEWKEQRRRDDC